MLIPMALLRVHPSSHRDPLFCLWLHGFCLMVAPASSHHAPASSHHAPASSHHAPASSHHGPCLFPPWLAMSSCSLSSHCRWLCGHPTLRWLSNIFTISLTALRLPGTSLKEEDSCSWKMNSGPGIMPSQLDTGTWQGRRTLGT